jgi:hypothetical protein
MKDFSIGYPMSDCPFWQLYEYIHVNNTLANKKVALLAKAGMNMLQLLSHSRISQSVRHCHTASFSKYAIPATGFSDFEDCEIWMNNGNVSEACDFEDIFKTSFLQLPEAFCY